MEYIRIEEIQAILPSLLQRLHNGEEFALTNHGEVVGKLMPTENENVKKRRAAIDAFRQFASEMKLGTFEELMEWRKDGRKGWAG